jgi:hypothetical protein
VASSTAKSSEGYFRAACSTIPGEASMPSTLAPERDISHARSPVPQPRSSILSPACGPRSSTTPRPSLETKPVLRS